jgi:glycosyltransferase involved in cell wall biosynthesis
MSKPRIAFIDSAWAANAYRKKTGKYGAIAYFRLVKPMQYLMEWFDIDFYGKNLEEFGEGNSAYWYLARKYDIIFSKHIDNGQGASALLATAEDCKKKVIVDLDDNYLQIRNDNPAATDYAPLKGGRYFLGAFISLANGLSVSTQPLYDLYSSLNEKRFILPNCNDIADWPHKPKKHKDGKIRIGYAGSITHNDDLELIWKPLGYVLNKYPHVRFEICGAIDPTKIGEVMEKIQINAERDITSQLWFYGGTPVWEGYTTILPGFGWDIGLAPLVDEPFNRGKSHIKWMDYAMCNMPTIASKVYPYVEDIQGVHTIQHLKTGILTTNEKEWILNLELLINNDSLRKELADNAYQYIKENWQYKDHIHKWKEMFEFYL